MYEFCVQQGTTEAAITCCYFSHSLDASTSYKCTIAEKRGKNSFHSSVNESVHVTQGKTFQETASGCLALCLAKNEYLELAKLFGSQYKLVARRSLITSQEAAKEGHPQVILI